MDFLWFLSELRTPFLDALMQLVTYLGQELVILPVICILYWSIDKRFAYQLAFTYFTAGLLVQSLKVTFRIPRPWVLDPAFPPVESAVSGATGYSFPSGHTQGATCLFMPLALRTKARGLKILCVCSFLLIGFSRMYLGCHTPQDVLVSMTLSLLIAWGIWHFRSIFLDYPEHTWKIAIIIGGISFLVALYTSILYHQQLIETHYAADCFKASGAGFGFALGYYLEKTRLNFDTKTRTKSGQIVKLLIGLSAALLLKEGLPVLIGTSPLAKMAKYFILVLWVIVIYPLCFHRITKRRKKHI